MPCFSLSHMNVRFTYRRCGSRRPMMQGSNTQIYIPSLRSVDHGVRESFNDWRPRHLMLLALITASPSIMHVSPWHLSTASAALPHHVSTRHLSRRPQRIPRPLALVTPRHHHAFRGADPRRSAALITALMQRPRGIARLPLAPPDNIVAGGEAAIQFCMLSAALHPLSIRWRRAAGSGGRR